MPGVRVQHATQRNVRFTIVESDRPYPRPMECNAPEFGGCGTTHLFKTHHLNLDGTGSVIVGDVLFEKIKQHLFANGFLVTNEVKRPPTLRVGLGPPRKGSGSWGNIPIIRGQER